MTTNNTTIASLPQITTTDTNGNIVGITLPGNLAAGNVLTDNLLYANGNRWDFGNVVATAGGPNTSIQFNNNGVLAGNAAFTANAQSATLTAYNLNVPFLATIENTITDDIIISTDLGNTGVLLNTGAGNTANTLFLTDTSNTVTANLVAGYYFGNGAFLTGIQAGSSYSNANVANYLPVYNGNIQASNANITRSLTVSNVANLLIGNGAPNLFLTTNSNGTGRWTKATVDVFGNFVSAAPFTLSGGSGFNAPGFSVLDNTFTANVSNTFHVGDRIFMAGNVGDVYTITSIDAPTTYSGTFLISPNLRVAYSFGSNISVSLAQPANGIIVAGQGNITYSNGQATINIFTQSGGAGNYSNANVANYLPTYTGNLASLTGNVTTTANISGNYILGNGSFLTGIQTTANTNYVTVNTNYVQIYTVGYERASATNAIDVSGDIWTYTYPSGFDATTYNPTQSQAQGDNIIILPGDLSTWAGGDQLAVNNTTTGPFLTVYSAVYDGSSQTTITLANPLTQAISPGDTIYYTQTYVQANTPTPINSIIRIGSNTGPNYTVVSISNYATTVGATGTVVLTVNTTQGPWPVGTQVFNPITITTATRFNNIQTGPNILANVSNIQFFTGNTLYIDAIASTSNVTGNYSNANVANYLPTYTGNLVSLTGNVVTTANVQANYFLGNAAFLTGLPTQYSNANVANYLPTYTGNLAGGNAIITNTVYANLFVGTFQGNISGNLVVPGSNTQVLYNNSGNAGANSGFTFNQQTQSVVVTGNVSANYFLGNGAFLTGISANVSFANSNSITYNTTNNTTQFSVVDSYIANIARGNASYAYRSDITFPSTYLLNSVAGRFMGAPTADRTIQANLIVPFDSTDGYPTNGWQLANVGNATLSGGTYAFSISDPIVVFDVAGQFNITEAQFGAGNTVAGGELNIRPVANLAAGTYPVRVAYVVNLGPSLQSVTQVNGNSNSNISLTGANVSLGNVANVKIYNGTTGQLLSTDGTGNLSWVDGVLPGIGWSVTAAPGFDTTGGTYVGWSGATQFPVFYANGQVLATSGFTSSTYLGATRNWPTDNAQSLAIFADLYQEWHNTVSGALQINTTPVDTFRFTINTQPLATGINPTQSNAVVQNLFNLTNANAGPEFVNSLQYDDASGLYPFQRAKGGAVVYTENLQQVLQAGNVANIGFTLTNNANITTTGNVSANYFLGNGAFLTGITGGGGNSTYIQNGNSNVSIPTANGNVSISVGGIPNIAVFTSSNVFLTNSVISNTLFLTPSTITGNHNTGTVAYSNVDDTLVFYTSVNDAPIHPGREVTFTGYNQSGATLAAGSVVYITGTHGQQPQIALANAQAIATAAAVGVVQYDIPNNANGIVTTVGEVSRFNTQTYTAGQTLYLDPATPGGVTTTIPTVPNVAIRVGFVEYVNPSNGKIYVSIRNAYTFANTIVGLDTYTGNIQAGNLVVTANATVQGNLRANSNVFISGNATFSNTIIANSVTPISLFNDQAYPFSIARTAGKVQLGANLTDTANARITFNARNFEIGNSALTNAVFEPNGRMTINADIPSRDQFTGSIIVYGGIGVSGNIYSNANISVSGNLLSTGNSYFAGAGNIFVTGAASSPGAALIGTPDGNLAFAPVAHYFAGVFVATTTALTATYNNGAAGVGATLTNAGAQAAIVIDGQTLTAGQRVLVKDQATSSQNGIYTVLTVGSASTNWVLARASDYDQPSEMLGNDLFTVTAGAVNGAAVFVQTNRITTVGTTAVVFDSSGVLTLANVVAAGNTTQQNVNIANTLTLGTQATGDNFVITPKNFNSSLYQLFYSNSNAGEFRFTTANATSIFTFGYGSSSGVLTNNGLQIRPTAQAARILPVLAGGATIGNLQLESTGALANIIMSGNVTIGTTAGTNPLYVADNFTGTVGLTAGSNNFVLMSSGTARTPRWSNRGTIGVVTLGNIGGVSLSGGAGSFTPASHLLQAATNENEIGLSVNASGQITVPAGRYKIDIMVQISTNPSANAIMFAKMSNSASISTATAYLNGVAGSGIKNSTFATGDSWGISGTGIYDTAVSGTILQFTYYQTAPSFVSALLYSSWAIFTRLS